MSRKPEDRDSLCKLGQLRSTFAHFIDVKFLEKILRTGIDINYKVPDGYENAGNTALHLEARRIYSCCRILDETLSENIRVLLRHGAVFTTRNNEEETALHRALGDLKFQDNPYFSFWGLGSKLSNKIIDVILTAHVDRSVSENPANKYGLTHFHVACMADHAAAVQMFLDKGVPADLVVNEDSPLFPGCYPLHIAAKSCALEVVNVLLKSGADPHVKDKEGMTALFWLIECNIKVVEFSVIEEQNIYLATWFSKLEINQKMINVLAKKHRPITTDEVILSDLHLVCTAANVAFVKFYLTQVSQINHQVSANSRLWPGYTAMHFAAYFDLETVKLLLSQGASITTKAANGLTPFEICLERYAIQDIHTIMMTQLSWKNITLLNGSNLFDLISAMQHIDNFKSFLDEYVDDINTSISRDSPIWPGYTPLHLAVLFSEQFKNRSNYTIIVNEDSNSNKGEMRFDLSLVLVEECLSRGADVTSADFNGCTPLHLAFRHQKTNTSIKLLQLHLSTLNPLDKYNLSHLHIACALGHKATVEKLLQTGADANNSVLSNFKIYNKKTYGNSVDVKYIYSGSTALHFAVASKSYETVKLLVDNGAYVNAPDKNNVTPVHCLLFQDYYWPVNARKMAASMLSSVNLTEIINCAGISHLHVASFFDNVEAVKHLLDSGADVGARLGCYLSFENFRYAYSNQTYAPILHKRHANTTALHIAVYKDSAKLVNLLIKHGADVLATSVDLAPAFCNLFCSNGEKACTKVFFRLFIQNDDLAKQVEKECGLTNFHLACDEVDPVLVKKLIDGGADVNAQLNEKMLAKAGYTPLHMILDRCCQNTYWASDSENDDAENDNPDIGNRNSIRDVLDATRILLAAGADVTLCNAQGNTPLHLIADFLSKKEFYGKLMDMMLNSIKNFHINPVGQKGMSHFFISCLQNNSPVIKKFLESGVDVNAVIDSGVGYVEGGDSCLHLIIEHQYHCKTLPDIETINALLEHGAKVNAQNDKGETVLHKIAQFKSDRTDILERMIRAGADLNQFNAVYQTPFAILLSCTDATPKGIKSFLEQGCLINDFNIVDQQGVMSQPLRSYGSELEDRNRIFDSLFLSRDITKLDTTGRTAIHNIVSAYGYVILGNVTVDEYGSLITRLCNRGCDIDSQDRLGRTALHLAAYFVNYKAIAALLMNGADVNIVDNYGISPFNYCNTSENEQRSVDMIKFFYHHMKKLQHLNLHVNEMDKSMIPTESTILQYNVDRMNKFLEEMKVTAVRIQDEFVSFSLRDILSETGVIAVYPYNLYLRLAIKIVSENIDIAMKDYGEIIGLFKLQCRKAQKRMALIKPAETALHSFVKDQLCIEKIIMFLSNTDLKNFILAIDLYDGHLHKQILEESVE